MSTLRLAMVQFAICKDTVKNLERAFSWIERAKQQQADVIVFPEEFNTTITADEYSETIPEGITSVMLSEAAKKFSMYIVGGSIAECDNGLIYNTTTVWDPQGLLINKYRKMHLFDTEIKGKFRYFESETTTAGDSLGIFEVKGFKFGLCICNDIRFEELARIYRKMGCHVLLYPSMCNMFSGRYHWTLLLRARATDNQCYVAGVAPPSSVKIGDSTTWGHSQLVNPLGEVLQDLETDEGMTVAELDMSLINKVRSVTPVFNQRRTDLYDTIWKKQL